LSREGSVEGPLFPVNQPAFPLTTLVRYETRSGRPWDAPLRRNEQIE
jgi:hypothetical protein